MQYVEFYKLQKDGSQKVIAICKLIDGKVICEGDEHLAALINRQKIEDGLKFLQRLKYNFKSGYLNASDVKEE